MGVQTSQRTVRCVAQRYLSAIGGHHVGLLVEADLEQVAVFGRRLVERLRFDPTMSVSEIIEGANEIVPTARIHETTRRVVAPWSNVEGQRRDREERLLRPSTFALVSDSRL